MENDLDSTKERLGGIENQFRKLLVDRNHLIAKTRLMRATHMIQLGMYKFKKAFQETSDASKPIEQSHSA